VWALLDPLSRAAQRIAPVLEFLERTLRPSIQARARRSVSGCTCCGAAPGRALAQGLWCFRASLEGALQAALSSCARTQTPLTVPYCTASS